MDVAKDTSAWCVPPRVWEEEDTTVGATHGARSPRTVHTVLKGWKSRVETLTPPGSNKGLPPAPRRKPYPAGKRPMRRTCCEGGVRPEEGCRDRGIGANCHCCWSDSDGTWSQELWLEFQPASQRPQNSLALSTPTCPSRLDF